MESQRRQPFHFGRLAMLALLVGVALCAVQVALALNEREWIGRGPAALAYLLGGFLLAGVLRGIAAALAQLDGDVARIEDAAYAHAEAADQLAGKINDVMRRGGGGGDERDRARAAARPAGGATNGDPVPREHIVLSHPPIVAAAPAVMPAADAPTWSERSVPPPAVDAPVDSLSPAPAPTPAAAVPPRETPVPISLPDPMMDLLPAVPEAVPEQAPEPEREPEVAIPPIAFVTADEPLPETEIVPTPDPDLEFIAAQERAQARMMAGAWDEAVAEVEAFARQFPDHAEGRQLVARVVRQRELAMEQRGATRPARALDRPAATAAPDATAAHGREHGRAADAATARAGAAPALDPEQDAAFQRTYERVQAAVGQRHWREALVGAEQLVRSFPGHPWSAGIRHQIGTIRENAEIEERREHEHHIEQLIREKRFGEAAAAADDVIERYPNSPQAKRLDEMLPRLRDLAGRSGR